MAAEKAQDLESRRSPVATVVCPELSLSSQTGDPDSSLQNPFNREVHEVQHFMASIEEDQRALEIRPEDSMNDLPGGNLDLNDNVSNGRDGGDVLLDLKKTHIKALKEMCVCIRGESASNRFIDVHPWQDEVSERQCTDQNIRPVHLLSYAEILKPATEGHKPHRTTITTGIAGIGKTACVEKLIHDWAAGSILSEFDFIFMFAFSKLNMLPQKTLSLMQLIQICYPHMQDCKEIFLSTSIKCLYIFDGLDESRQTLNFENQLACYDECESRSLESLLSNLIRGNIHPSSSVWITTRPAGMGQIPLCYIDRLTELQGFSEHEKMEYFHKKYENRHLAEKMISVMKKERSLSCLCYLPIFCSVLSTFLEDALKSFQCHELSDYMPVAITPVFNKFLVHILSHQQQRQAYLRGAKQTFAELMKSRQRDIISLGKLAFDLLRSETFIFSEHNLRMYNADVSLAESGICKEFAKENANNSKKIFCFVHGALQEYMAALYVLLSFNNTKSNPLMASTKPKSQQRCEKPSYFHILKQACKENLKSSSGHFGLFLRFLCGLGTKTNQQSLKGLMTSCGIHHDDITKIIQFLKEKLQEDIAPEKCLTLIHCLIELGDHSFVVQSSKILATEAATYRTLSPMDYSAMAFALQMSNENSETFNLSEHKISSIGLRRLAPVLFSFTSLKMNGSNLGDSGVKILSQVTRCRDGKLQNLELERNDLTHKCCEALAFILSNNSMLRNLNLCDNHLGDKGICLLSTTLKQPQCRIQKLNLSNNNLSTGSWEELVSVLMTNQTLRELNVSNNRVGEAGLRILSTALKNSRCKLQKLGLNNTSTFDFGMMGSYLEETGVEVLCDVLRNPNCTLKSLELASNCLSQKNYGELTSAIRINHTLTHLDLSSNVIQDTGINVLSMALMDPSCSIQSLRMTDTKLTPTCCEKLATVLVTNQTLRELDLSMNKLGDSGVHALSTALKNPNCKLETLRLKRTSLTDGCCHKLMAALSTTQTITHLDLSENSFTDCSLSNISNLILTCGNLVVIRLEQNQFTTHGQMMIKKLNLEKPNIEIVIERTKKY
ncbi:NACHT, LRR and PYD domains-containing protein 12-like [Pristis pectinata]|uniref:NACHT, LRR and PYD domains-containing protein 12-like n=1 Tax=Pristis pectinata TaxID=685728 RepID=UPI00223CAE3C|nr:NACHT, LRR and PYD domains-containing protein 12-like [Pristis pectinata]